MWKLLEALPEPIRDDGGGALDGPTPGSDPAFRARETDLPCEGGERNKGLRGNECVRSLRPKPPTRTSSPRSAAFQVRRAVATGGRTPFFNGYQPESFRTTDATGNDAPPGGIEMVMPGSNVEMTVD